MPRDLLGRPPLRVSELPPNRVMLYPGEPRAIVCPGCNRWQVPHDGGIRRHTIGIDSRRTCPQTGRRVWFDLTSTQWRAQLEVACRSQYRPRGLDKAVREALAAAPEMLTANQAVQTSRAEASPAQPDLQRMRIPIDRGWAPLRRNGAI
jgi:hypothetical protein